MRGGKLIAAAVCLAALFPAAAEAEKFTGRSEQGKVVRLWTHPNGKVRAFSIRWRTRDCDNGTRMHARQTGFVRPDASAGAFHDQGAYTVHYTDARVRFATSVSGEQVSADRWRGTFKVRAHIDRPGGPSDDCRLGPVTWSVRR